MRLRGAGEGEMCYCLIGTESQFGKIMFWTRMVVMAAQ